jgi:hypothetical protein
MWIINGPYPFSSFGGGPAQLFMYVVLFLVGVICTASAMLLGKAAKK